MNASLNPRHSKSIRKGKGTGRGGRWVRRGPNIVASLDDLPVENHVLDETYEVPGGGFQLPKGSACAYFFKKAGYVRYNIATDMVDVGPVAISKFWNLPPEFQSNVDAAVNWTFPGDLAGLMRAAGLPVNEAGDWRGRARPGPFTPIGITMHHTAHPTGGANSLADIVKGDAKIPGPKANFHVERGGVINIVSGGRSNHAGFGAQRVLDEVNRGVAPAGTAAQRGLPDGPTLLERQPGDLPRGVDV